MFKRSYSRHSKVAAMVMAMATLLSAVVLTTSLTASADTAGNLLVTRATSPYQSNVAPNGPLTGLKTGDVVSVTATGDGSGTAPANNIVFGIDVRLCRSGLNITLTAQFNATGGNCIGNPLAPGTSALSQVAIGAPNLTGTVNFIIGTGAETAATHVGPGAPIVCDSANPCDLWVKEAVPTGVVASGNAFVHYGLTFAGNPDAPAAPTATAGNATATVSWTAPANTGNSTITNYTVTPYIGVVAQAPVTVGNVLTTTLPSGSLTNFTAYTFTVKATNAAGFTSGESPASAAVTPTPTPPVITGGSAGNAQVTLTWTPASGSPTGYTVASTPAGGTCTPAAGPSATGCIVTGLTNGQAYTFTVTANYAGGSATSATFPSSGSITPTGQFVTQTFTVTRPAGALVIGEACSGLTPYLGVPNQNCNIDLGTAALNAAGTYYIATGTIQQVTVLDTRDTDIGWTVTASMTNFTSASDSFPACNFGLNPNAVGTSGTPVYTQSTAAGAAVAADCTLPTNGYGSSHLVAQANAATPAPGATGGLGYSQINGTVGVQIPLSANAGLYTGVLTFTLLTK